MTLEVKKLQSLLMDFCHGSGFDGRWYVHRHKTDPNKFTCQIEYHCMDGQGGYDGWVTVSVTVKYHPDNGHYLSLERVTFPGAGSYARRHYIAGLEDYYRETVQNALEDVKCELEYQNTIDKGII